MAKHGAYRLMIDYCYINEGPLPKKKSDIYEICKAATKANRDDVDAVLEAKWVLHDDGYHNDRIDEELEMYRSKAGKNRENGNLGGRPKKTQTVTEHETQNKPNNNLKPESTNQNPELKDTPSGIPSAATAVCVALRSEGINASNAQHPELLELINDGAGIGEFIEAGKIAKEKGKGFGYVIGIVRNTRAEAAARGNAQPQLSKKAQGIQSLQELISD